MKPILLDKRGAVYQLTLNRPEVRNAITGTGIDDAIVEACGVISKDRLASAVIVTGAGDAFCAGGHVPSMARLVQDDATLEDIAAEYRAGIQGAIKALFALDVPLIAAINGPAIGAGLDLACVCDIRLAAQDSVFAASFVALGLVPGDGGAWLLPRAVGYAVAAELFFTARRFAVPEALQWGLISRAVPREALLPAAQEIAESIAKQPVDAVRQAKRLLRQSMKGASLDALLELSALSQAVAHKSPAHRAAVERFIAGKAGAARKEAQ